MKLHIHFSRLFLYKIALFLSNFLILYLLSNFYPNALSGQFYYPLSILPIVATFANLGIENSLFYFLKKRIFTTSHILAIAYKILLFFFVICIFLLGVGYLFFTTINLYTLFFSLLFICSLFLQYIISAHFLHLEKGWIPQMGLLLINILFIGFLGLNKFYFDIKNATSLLNIYFSLFFIVSLFSLLVIADNRADKKIILPPLQQLKLLFKFGKYPYWSSALFFLGSSIDLIAVKIYCNTDLSSYVQASKIFQFFCSISALLYYPFMGKIIESNYSTGVKYLAQSSRIITLILFLAILPFLAGCYFFLGFLFPVNYSPIIMLLGYFSVSLFSTSLSYFYTSYFVATKKNKQNLMSASVFVITIIISSSLLVPHLGIKGGAIANSMAILFSLGFDIFYFAKINKLSLSDILIIKKEDIVLIKNNLLN